MRGLLLELVVELISNTLLSSRLLLVAAEAEGSNARAMVGAGCGGELRVVMSCSSGEH